MDEDKQFPVSVLTVLTMLTKKGGEQAAAALATSRFNSIITKNLRYNGRRHRFFCQRAENAYNADPKGGRAGCSRARHRTREEGRSREEMAVTFKVFLVVLFDDKDTKTHRLLSRADNADKKPCWWEQAAAAPAAGRARRGTA